MTDRDIYNVAEWLAHNADYLKEALRGTYLKARQLPMNEARELIKDKLMYKFCEYNSKFPVFEIEEAFNDERVKIIVDKTFNKEFIYEH